MTASAPRRVYWDTGLFLSFLNKGEEDRRRICEDNLKHARDGRIAIYTSYWTAVEVIKPKWIPKGAPLTEEQVKLIQGMFQWPFLKKVQVHQTVAFKAADLSRQYGLKPADAIHAATALVKNVDAMQVFDRDFRAIAHLIQVEEPKYLTVLPLLDVPDSIGPTPEKVDAAKPQLDLTFSAPTASPLPASQSPDAEPESKPEPERDRPSARRDDPAQPPPDSSLIVPPPPPSKQ